MLCVIWRARKYRWTCATTTLENINIYLYRMSLRLVLFVILLWPLKIQFDQWFFYFSVHGDRKRNIYLQCWWVTESFQIKGRQPLTEKLLESIRSSKSKNNRKVCFKERFSTCKFKMNTLNIGKAKLYSIVWFKVILFTYIYYRNISFSLKMM